MSPTGHAEYSLSKLDLSMVKSVPPGGNWRDIPASIPSERLVKIRLTGGRTTLYGRLSWDKPSYTITTYFNRPGNGCYIHPKSNRVITSLEAARIQSFTDNFRFFGSKTSRLKQIGNAVPPLLSYSLAKQIKQVIPEAKYVVDLFSGAGGLSLGFHWAGFVTGVASDFFGDALRTYAQNFPKTKTVLGDITQKKVLDEIISLSTCLPQVDIVMGGPPCQGFSTAGKRMIDDPRNALYKQFVKVVKELKPKVFLMENVEGLISINGGKTYEEIKKTFQNLGYQVEGRKLLAAEYGVPQLRKRVVIVGVRQKSDDLLFPKPILSKNNFVTVREAIGDLPSRPLVSVEDQVPYAKAAESDYQNFTRGELSAHSFLRTLKRVEMQRSNF